MSLISKGKNTISHFIFKSFKKLCKSLSVTSVNFIFEFLKEGLEEESNKKSINKKKGKLSKNNKEKEDIIIEDNEEE